MDFFWAMFEKSGNIEAYLGYKESTTGKCVSDQEITDALEDLDNVVAFKF